MSKVKVIIDDNNDCEPAQLWRLDAPGEAERFFQHIRDNAELGDKFTFKAISQKEWKEAVRFGEQLA